jgi:Fe-S-cluster containining protein
LKDETNETASFRCTMCGECCKGYGGIVVTPKELMSIAEYLALKPEDFFARYCELLNGTISIKSEEGGYCLLYDHGCTVHPVKPTPCREWPFFKNIAAIKENWLIAKNNCPGILPESTYEDFLKDAEKLRTETKKQP